MLDIEKKIKQLQKRKIIYVVIACFLILLNLLIDLISLAKGELVREVNNSSSGIGYFIGSQFFIIFGLFLLYRVFKLNRQI